MVLRPTCVNNVVLRPRLSKQVDCKVYTRAEEKAHYLVSRPADVDEVGEEDGVLGARQSTGGHLTGTLLYGDPLVVLVERLGLEGERRRRR